jgi:hypothetical protein
LNESPKRPSWLPVFTVKDVLAKHQHLSQESAQSVADNLNRPPKSVKAIMEAETVGGDNLPALGRDGLTEPMRQLNDFAEENALPRPFMGKESLK